MAITLTLYEWNGSDDPDSSDPGTSITDIDMGSTDAANFDPASYMIEPGDNSYSKHLKINFSGIPSGNRVEEAKLFKISGDYVDGESLKLNENFVKGTSLPSETDIGGSDLPTSLPGSQNINLPDSGNVLEADGYSEQFALQIQTETYTPDGATNTKVLAFVFEVT